MIKTHMNNMKKYLSLCIMLLCLCSTVMAQQEKVVVKGVVTDEAKEPLIGVNVTVKDMPGLGSITDMNGHYSITMEPYRQLVFTYIGYESKEVMVKEQRTINVVMKESVTRAVDEVVITGTGVQRKLTQTGAITTVDVGELKRNPSSSIVNALAGNVPGIMARQTSGQPGKNISEFWIRGISTFGANSSAYVLVDGFERSMDEINIEDIETFTVLKDASATAIYGSKGANGVVLITTKRGKAGKIKIDAKVETTYNTRTVTPKFEDGFTYASLMNESRITRNNEAVYKPEELDILRLGLDTDLYPNVDWMDMLLKDGAWSNRINLNMSGGGTTARYFVSASYVKEDGMYNTDESLKGDYNTNAAYHRWNYRLNTDIDITKTTLLKVGVAGFLSKRNSPGLGDGDVWGELFGYNPIKTPVMYSNGYIPAIGSGNKTNPWVAATQTGFNENWTNNIETNISLEQNFDFITKGLKFVGRFGYDSNNQNTIRRLKWPEQWLAERARDPETGELRWKKISGSQNMKQESSSSGNRREFLDMMLNWDRSFGAHHPSATIKYTQDSYIQTQNLGEDLKTGINKRNQDLAGRVAYNWNYRYFIDFNFGYNGSENFHKDHRFGFFPAISGAWNLAEEPFMKKIAGKWLNMLKIRYSYGKTGNDAIYEGNKRVRFPYLYSIATDNNVYHFEDIGTGEKLWNGKYYSTVASPAISWEVATKQDLGIDFSFFNDKLTGEVDYFKERRDGIYMTRSYIPYEVGIGDASKANVGIVEAKGFDGHFAFKHKIGKVNFTLRGNITYSKNEVIEKDEENTIYGYKLDQGHRVNQARGLIALGLFKDYEDIRNSPRQTFGEVMPGDIKYKDVNGDGIIDSQDRVAIGATTRPNLVYGFGFSAKWKGLDFNAHFQGAGKSSFFVKGTTIFMFQGGDGWGNVLKEMAESNRWILGENEDPNAEFPRLTYGDNKNNYQESNYWLRDGSYLRLKTLDIGYTFPKAWVNKIHLNQVRVFFIGTNLLTFSPFKYWDPELGSSDGKKYPLNKTLSLGVSVNL